MIRGIHHAGLCVSNLESSVNFYCDAAGLSEVHRLSLKDDEEFSAIADVGKHSAEVVVLKGTNAFLIVAEFEIPHASRPDARSVADAGISHICSQARDIELLEAKYRGAGACFRENPVDLGNGTSYAYVQDRELNTIELQGTIRAPATQRPWLNHVALSTHDVDRLSAFYADLLGYKISRTAEFGGNPLIDKVTGFDNTHMKAAWVEGANQTLEFLQYLNPVTATAKGERPIYEPGWMYSCFEVTDIRREYQRILKLGARFITPPQQFRGAKLCFARDPDGNLFALLELPEDQGDWSLSTVDDREILQATRKDG